MDIPRSVLSVLSDYYHNALTSFTKQLSLICSALCSINYVWKERPKIFIIIKLFPAYFDLTRSFSGGHF